METVTTRPAHELRGIGYTGLSYRKGRSLPYAVWLRGRIERLTPGVDEAMRLLKGLIKNAEVMRKPPLMDVIRKRMILRS
ncbi:hypothetical protein LCGC14_1125700 [marine sediment metagenome]|uniref:Uncharacterized protein n=1 Tax=marine sediment metagenome TaxID=412755 RepID=A0A0F9MQK0_9ZZZZ